MRTSGNLRLRHVLLVLMVIVVGGFFVVQQVGTPRATAQATQGASEIRELAASDSLPPEMKAMKEQKTPPAPKDRPSMAELEEIIKQQPGGPERLEKAKKGVKTGELAASDSLPPEMRAMKEQKTPPAPKDRPSMAELEEIIKQQPGGPERLEKAKKGEKPAKAPGQQSSLGKLGSSLARLNPFRVCVANAGQTYTQVLQPTVNTSTGGHAGLKRPSDWTMLMVGGANITYDYPNNYSFYIEPRSTTYWDPVTPCSRSNPSVTLQMIVPREGWYVVSLNGYSASRIKLYHSTASGNVLLNDFPSLATAALRRCPTLQYLSAGTHYFNWVACTSYIRVDNVTVDSSP